MPGKMPCQRTSLHRVDGRMGAAPWLQIEMAAKGCVSGTLKEWPMLAAALRKLGHELPPTTPAQELRDLCRAAVNSPIDPKLSDSPAWRDPCAGGGKAEEGSTGHDAQASSLERMVRRRSLSAKTLTELDETLRLSRAEADLCYSGYHPYEPAHENCIAAIVMARRKLGLPCDEDSLVRSHERALEVVNKGGRAA